MVKIQLAQLQDLEKRLNYIFTDINHLKNHLTSYCHYFSSEEFSFSDEVDETSLRDSKRLFSELCARKEEYNRVLYQSISTLGDNLNDTDRGMIYKKMLKGDKTLILFFEHFSLNELCLFPEDHPLYNMLSINLALFVFNAMSHDAQIKKFDLIAWLIPVIVSVYIESIEDMQLETTRNMGETFFADREFRRAEKARECDSEYLIQNFESQILSFSLDKIKQPLKLQKIESAFDINDSDGTTKYFKQFIPCILESARAEIESEYMNLKKQDRPVFFKIQLLKKTSPSEESDESMVEFSYEIKTKDLPKIDHTFSMEVLLLQQYFTGSYQAQRAHELLAIASVHHIDSEKQIAHLRIKILKTDTKVKPELFKADVTWKAFWLAGLTSYSRMYDACLFKCDVPFLQQIITGRLPEWPSIHALSRLHALPVTEKLNPSQLNAVTRFHQAQKGLYCLQGPPGTGKTTTIAHLLTMLARNPDKKVMVCAPANKAVHVIAIRALQVLPEEVDLALTGIGKELPSELKAIYASEQGKYIVHDLKKIQHKFQEFHLILIKELNQGRGISEENRVQLDDLSDELIQLLNQNNALWEKLMSTSLFPLDRIALNAIQRLIDLEKTLYEHLCYYKNIKDVDEQQSFEKSMVQKASERYECFSYALKPYLEEMNKTDAVEILLLQRAQIIFCTLVASGRKNLNKYIRKIDLLIVDEAAQALEPETLIPLKFAPDKLILIGDPKQLPATIKSKACEAHDYQRSMMARLMEDCGQPYEMLDIQYRMHPAICHWTSTTYYSGKLKTAPGLLARSSPIQTLLIPQHFKQACVFFNVKSAENRRAGSKGQSIDNDLEAEAIIDILCQCLLHMDSHQIGVIAFYAAQVELLKQKAAKKRGDLAKKIAETHIGTVDAFQGEEKDFIILATTRTSESTGFLRDQRRINVASSRARHGFFVVADAAILDSNNDLARWCMQCQHAASQQGSSSVVVDYTPSEILVEIGQRNDQAPEQASNFLPSFGGRQRPADRSRVQEDWGTLRAQRPSRFKL